ncbi:MAG: oligosaccharide flippase family protein [Paludibacteraceae bacterium]|nr:oligosaccharide flippase family protein [Paludibacteraceae bacterium]
MKVPANIIKKVKGNKTLVHGGLFSLYSFIGRGISFFLLMLLAKYIPPAAYGHLSLFNTVVQFVTIFMALYTAGYVNISFFRKSEEDFKKDFTTVYVIGIGTLFFFLLVIGIGGTYISNILDLSQKLLVYAVIISFFSFSFHIQQSLFRVQEKVVTYGLYNVGNAILNFVLSLFFVIALGQGWIGRVNAYLLCAVFFGILSVYTFTHFRLFKLNFEKDRYKEILSWGIPLIPHHATGWIRQGLDRYIINYYYAAYQVGIFSFALNICNIIEMIGTAFNATNSVTLYKTLSSKELSNVQKQEKLRRQTRLIGLIYFVATIVILVSMSVLTYFALPKYIQSIPFIWILCVAGFLKCIYFLYCNYLIYYGKTKQLMFITFGTSALHLLLSLMLTQFSLYWTAVIYVFVQGIITLLVYLKSKKILKVQLSS